MTNPEISKKCWQLKRPNKHTPCFRKAGSLPCSAPNCAVDKRMQELKPIGMEIDLTELSHYVCRISSESADNQEYLERIGDAGLIRWLRSRFPQALCHMVASRGWHLI